MTVLSGDISEDDFHKKCSNLQENTPERIDEGKTNNKIYLFEHFVQLLITKFASKN